MFKTTLTAQNKQYIYGGITLLWMVLIYSFSAQNGTSSGGLSSDILAMIGDFLHLDIASMEVFHYLIRKGAHAFEYFMLAIWLYLFFTYSKYKKHAIILAIMGSFLYACSDEFHQLFIADRSGNFMDVLVDTSGACISMLLFPWLHKYILQKKGKENCTLS